MTQTCGSRVLGKSAISSILLLCVWNLVYGQIRYSIPEEVEIGTFVGKIREDLGLSVKELSSRKFRIVSIASKRYLDVNRLNGILFVSERIDREQLCGQSDNCVLLVEAVVEDPVEQYRVEVEILDVNDNSPIFPNREIRLEIPESVLPGARFPLERAHDLDGRNNSVGSYQLDANEHFTLDIQSSGKWKLPELILENIMDREKQSVYNLSFTVTDGGHPERSGTAHIVITILDANDNAPVFQKSLYNVNLSEDLPLNSLVIKLNVTDLDEGTNSEIVYSFSSNNEPSLTEIFMINPNSGEIRTKGSLDFEQSSVYQIHIEAKDRSQHPLSAHCNVRVEITDVNDNAPELSLNSISSRISEDVPIGTLIALFSVTDRDSNKNGQMDCSISPNVPFDLKSPFANSYRLVTSAILDREIADQHVIMLTCKDRGSPPLFSNRNIIVNVSDVNDNAPQFTRSSYRAYVAENNEPGSFVGSVTALDYDIDRNSQLVYTLLDNPIPPEPVSSYLYVNSTDGRIYSKISFDYEQIKALRFHVRVQDAGFPSLSSDAVIQVIVLDKNDNPPTILTPQPNRNPTLKVPRSAVAGYLVTKITASDADSGKNAQLSYHLKHSSASSLFVVSPTSGEVRSVRRIKDSDASTQRLVIRVKDHGYPALSATTTLTLTIVKEDTTDPPELSGLHHELNDEEQWSFYIIITLGTTSLLLLVIIIVLVVLICPMGEGTASASICPCANCCTRELEYRNTNHNLHISRESYLLPSLLEVRGNGSLTDTCRYKIQSAPQPVEMFFTPFNSEMADVTVKDTRYALQYTTKAAKNWSNEVSLGNQT
ncbi:protocadherin gamma-C5-like [Narcine bancroftii]|uniref:protocadherin gamma-C5-like n=1 Tax=Narcine bancroftii TaxID=1343680 RepID=UPI00383117CF